MPCQKLDYNLDYRDIIQKYELMSLAYLTSKYPARSHTFIRREIEVLREQGYELHVFSLHRCEQSEILNEREQREYESTWSVFPLVLKDFLFSHFSCLIQSPRNYFRALLVGFDYYGGSLRGFIYTFFYFAEAIYLAEQMKKKNIVALHVHFANSGAKVAAVVAEYLQIPWMISLHGNSDFGYPSILWLKDMVKHAHFVRCVSDYGASQVKCKISLQEYRKVFVAYCGLPSNYQNKKVGSKRKENGPIKLLSVGRLSSEKGQILLIDMASKLKQKHIKFTIEIVGDGTDRTMLEEQTRALGLEDSIHFIGAVEEMAVFDYMREADIFICSSFMEGLPQVLMESMLINTPVIAPYIAGIPELVSDGRTGMLFPAGNVDALAQKVIELVNDPVLYKEVVSAGRQKVLNDFLIDKTIVPLLEHTQAIL